MNGFKPTDLPKVLKQVRLDAGLAQWQLAQKLNVSQASIYSYETNRVKIPPDILESWAEACGMKISFVIEDATGNFYAGVFVEKEREKMRSVIAEIEAGVEAIRGILK